MATKRFDDILRQAREDLTEEEQQELARALSKLGPATNGASSRISLHDALAKRGIIGSIKDAPADLGTNSRFMEGFGRDD